MVAGANATGIDAFVGEYDCSMSGPPAVPSSTGNCRFRLQGGGTHVTILFS